MKKIALLISCLIIYSCGGEEIIEEISPPCGYGTIKKDDGTCIIDESLCAEGTHWENEQCVPDSCIPEKEVCDYRDNDCDGKIDEDFPRIGDQCFGVSGVCAEKGKLECASNKKGIVCSTDVGGSKSRAEEEICGDNIDNDCDGEIDEVCNKCYPDGDGDGFVSTDSINFLGLYIFAEECPPGYLLYNYVPYQNEWDCDDSNPEVNPQAIEICDGINNNCKEGIDKGCHLSFCLSDTDCIEPGQVCATPNGGNCVVPCDPNGPYKCPFGMDCYFTWDDKKNPSNDRWSCLYINGPTLDFRLAIDSPKGKTTLGPETTLLKIYLASDKATKLKYLKYRIYVSDSKPNINANLNLYAFNAKLQRLHESTWTSGEEVTFYINLSVTNVPIPFTLRGDTASANFGNNDVVKAELIEFAISHPKYILPYSLPISGHYLVF